MPSLRFRRLRGDLIQVFKILNGFDNVNVERILKLCQESMSNTRNSLLKNFITQSQTNKKRFSLNNRIAHYWNNLANNTKVSNSLNTFKNHLAQEKHIEKLKFIYDT